MTDDLRYHLDMIAKYADDARRDIINHRNAISSLRKERESTYHHDDGLYRSTFWFVSAQIWRSRAAHNLRMLREHKGYVLLNYDRRFQEEVFHVNV